VALSAAQAPKAIIKTNRRPGFRSGGAYATFVSTGAKQAFFTRLKASMDCPIRLRFLQTGNLILELELLALQFSKGEVVGRRAHFGLVDLSLKRLMFLLEFNQMAL
jgi:hypothetical protein